jgi:hypothetical protein
MTVTVAEVNGLNLVTNVSQGYSANNNAFKKYSLKFVATSCKTYISFKGTGAEDSLGALLDAVSLKRYEPSTNCDCN